MRLSSKLCYSTFASVLLVGCSIQSHGFEQGSYYVIDLVDSAETRPALGRLAVPKAALAEREAGSNKVVAVQERSEFEIDFTAGLEGTNDAGFDSTTALGTDIAEDIEEFSSDTFDFGSRQNDTVFGK